MRLVILILALALPSVVLAQQQTVDVVFLQRALAAIEQQRNQALTAQAIAEAKIGGLSDELTKANAKIKELEAKETPDAK